MSRVDALDVAGRIRFGESQTLRLREGRSIRRPGRHLRENEVRRAVKHAADLEDLFARERFSNRANDRNRASDGCLVGDRDPVLRREGSQLGAASGKQVFIGGDDVLPATQRLFNQLGRDAGPTDAFDDDVDVRVFDQATRVLREEGRWNFLRPRFRKRTYGNARKPVIDSTAGSDRRGWVHEQSRHAASDGSTAKQGEANVTGDIGAIRERWVSERQAFPPNFWAVKWAHYNEPRAVRQDRRPLPLAARNVGRRR